MKTILGALFVVMCVVSNSWALPVRVHPSFSDASMISGDMHLSTGSVVLSMTQNTWVQITNGGNDLFSSDHNNGLSYLADELVIPGPGVYTVFASVSFTGSANDVYNLALSIDDAVQTTQHIASRRTSNNDTGNFSFNGIFVTTESVRFGLYMQNIANNNDATIINSNFAVIKIRSN